MPVQLRAYCVTLSQQWRMLHCINYFFPWSFFFLSPYSSFMQHDRVVFFEHVPIIIFPPLLIFWFFFFSCFSFLDSTEDFFPTFLSPLYWMSTVHITIYVYSHFFWDPWSFCPEEYLEIAKIVGCGRKNSFSWFLVSMDVGCLAWRSCLFLEEIVIANFAGYL